MINCAIFNRAPLTPNTMAPLPLGAIKPRGWLLEQLMTARNGLTGKLYTFWDDVKNSAWRGGDGDAWERAPYYLDGLVPLAWELDDEELKSVCMEYIEWTLASQREDGFFGPKSNEDWWPRMVMLKVLMQYFTATGDRRVPEFMFNYFKYQYATLDQKPMYDWAVARGAENMQAVIWLYNLTGKKFLLKLLEKLQKQTLDWTTHFSIFPFVRPLSKLIPWDEMQAGLEREGQHALISQHRPYYSTQYHFSHVVNMAMGLKAPGIISTFRTGSKEVDGFHMGYEKLMKFHGVANGMFTGDEHINGNSPTQGTECCAVNELMYTAESLLGVGTGEAELGDVLEKVTFNALPGTLTPDMMAHQYVQQANQIRVSIDRRNWYNNGDDANIYGLEPHFGCCTANMHQGWPRYCASLWYASQDGGLTAISYAPCQVRFRLHDTPVRVTVETVYPFEETVRIHVDTAKPVAFPLRLRVPAWAKEATARVNGGEEMSLEAGSYALIEREFTKGDVITLRLPMQPRITRWARLSAAVEVGPLLMAFRPEEKWEVVREHPVAPDYQVTTEDAWNWALVEGGELTLEMKPENASPFGQGESAVRVWAEACPVSEWTMKDSQCGQLPVEPRVKSRSITRIELVPYGDTGLRIAQFPMAVKPEPSKKEHEKEKETAHEEKAE